MTDNQIWEVSVALVAWALTHSKIEELQDLQDRFKGGF